MIRLIDGPAAGTVLALHRAPMYLRIVVDHATGKVDGLDQLDDTPADTETVHVYRLASDIVWVHLNMGSTRRGSGFYPQAEYVHLPDVEGEAVRSMPAWRTWAAAQPVVP